MFLMSIEAWAIFCLRPILAVFEWEKRQRQKVRDVREYADKSS